MSTHVPKQKTKKVSAIQRRQGHHGMKGAASGIKAIESDKYLTYHRKLELGLISKD